MKRILPRLLIIFLLPSYFHSYSQNLTGIWRGYFITEDRDEYKFELQIVQKGNSISGVSYSYLSTIFYGKATLTGNFSRSSNNTMIQEIKTVELRMSESSVACIMKCMFEYTRSGKEEFLEGFYTSKFEKNDTLFGMIRRKGADCGGGKVYLRKVATSDFYVEPFLRNKVRDSLRPEKISTNKTTTTKKPPVTSKPVVKTNTPVKKSIAKTNTTVRNKTTNLSTTNTPAKKVDSVTRITQSDIKKEIAVKPFSSSDALKNRENELVKILTVNDPNVIVKLYDNGEIDGDSISVYLDKKLVLEHQMLKATPIIIKIKMDDDNNDEHELVMVAENLGRIPPNTSLMIVESGDKRYNVFVTSTEKKNAVVRFKYQKVK